MSEPIKVSSKILVYILFSISSFSSLCTADSLQPTEVAPVSSYIDAIEAVEAQHSTYSEELADLYLGLGRSLLTQQDFLSAKRAFERGMQIERINNGLHSINQRPFLLSLADTESYLGNWKQSRNALDNLYSINWHTYGENDPRLLPVLDEILDWFLQTYKRRGASGGYENLIVAERVGQTIDTIMTNSDTDPSVKSSKYKKLASLHYVIANHIREYGNKNGSEVTFTTGQSSLKSRNLTSSHLHFQRGKRALEKVVESLVEEETDNLTEQALAIAQLGDWYLVFGQKFAAQRTYKLASDILINLDSGENSSAVLFDKPALIKFDLEGYLGDSSEKSIASQEIDEDTIEVGMTVSRVGAISDFEVINPPQEITKKQLANLRGNLRNARFRPKILNGETVEASHREIFQVTILER